MIAGRARELGLGPLRDINLTQARQLAYEARQLKRQGLDPLETRRERQQGAAVRWAKTMTFEECAKTYITAHQAGWRSLTHRRQWPTSLEQYVYPVFGALPVDAIDTGLVLRVLEPICTTRPRPRRGCAGASRRYWIGPRHGAIERARTLPAGAAISKIYCRRAASCAPSCIMRHCRIARSPRSSSSCGNTTMSARGRSNSRS